MKKFKGIGLADLSACVYITKTLLPEYVMNLENCVNSKKEDKKVQSKRAQGGGSFT